MAQYLSTRDLKELKDGDIMIERDVGFRPDLEKKKVKTTEVEAISVCGLHLHVCTRHRVPY